MSGGSERSLLLLIGDAIGEAQTLVAKQYALFHAEVGGSIRAVAIPTSLFLLAALFVLAAMLVLLVAIVKGLALLVGSEIIAALIVGGGFAAITLALFVVGCRMMSLSNLEPMRTQRQLARDRDALRSL